MKTTSNRDMSHNVLLLLPLLAATMYCDVLVVAQERPGPKEVLRQRVTRVLEQRSGTVRPDQPPDVRLHDERAVIGALAQIARGEPTGALHVLALEELGQHALTNRHAIVALVENIDEPPSFAPIFTGDPLEHLTAARSLVKCGLASRSHILDSLGEQQSHRALHIKAFVLAKLDQTDYRPFTTEITMLRLRQEIKLTQDGQLSGDREMRTKNLEAMIAKLSDPNFAVVQIPGR